MVRCIIHPGLRITSFYDIISEGKTCSSLADRSAPDKAWQLEEGFVAAECLSIYQASRGRPNLIDNHLALLLSVFIHYGILDVSVSVLVH